MACTGTLQALSGRKLQQLDGQLTSTHSGTQWFLAADDGQRWALDFQGTPDAPAGSRVEVTVRHHGHGQRRLLLEGPPRQLTGATKQRSLLHTSGTAPTGPVTFAIFIMDLSPCGTAGPATTVQVG